MDICLKGCDEMDITIIDHEHNRKVTFDNLKKIRIKNGIVQIFDYDGWGTAERIEDYEFIIEDGDE